MIFISEIYFLSLNINIHRHKVGGIEYHQDMTEIDRYIF